MTSRSEIGKRGMVGKYIVNLACLRIAIPIYFNVNNITWISVTSDTFAWSLFSSG